jgi:hypothetical protein
VPEQYHQTRQEQKVKTKADSNCDQMNMQMNFSCTEDWKNEIYIGLGSCNLLIHFIAITTGVLEFQQFWKTKSLLKKKLKNVAKRGHS